MKEDLPVPEGEKMFRGARDFLKVSQYDAYKSLVIERIAKKYKEKYPHMGWSTADFERLIERILFIDEDLLEMLKILENLKKNVD